MKLIKEIEKPCVAIKALAAGRPDPVSALRFAFENIKPIDAVAVGTFCKVRPDETKHNAEICRRFGTVTGQSYSYR